MSFSMKRLMQSGVIFLGLLGMLTVSRNDELQKREALLQLYSAESPYSGVIVATTPEISALPVIEVKQTIEVASEALNSPELATLTYQTYSRMGYSEETFYGDLELLALMCLAEAENQPELGKRLVIDSALNRMDSPYWRDDDTLAEVISHPGQYESYWNGRIDRVSLTDEVVELVYEELYSRTNSEVIYFNTGYYANYGYPIIQVGDHYFCGQIGHE